MHILHVLSSEYSFSWKSDHYRNIWCRKPVIYEVWTVLVLESSVMLVQWNSSLSVLPLARVQFPAAAECFKGFFPGWSHSANPSWASVAENGSISPQWHHTTCGQRGGRPNSTTDRLWLIEKKILEPATFMWDSGIAHCWARILNSNFETQSWWAPAIMIMSSSH